MKLNLKCIFISLVQVTQFYGPINDFLYILWIFIRIYIYIVIFVDATNNYQLIKSSNRKTIFYCTPKAPYQISFSSFLNEIHYISKFKNQWKKKWTTKRNKRRKIKKIKRRRKRSEWRGRFKTYNRHKRGGRSI